MASAVKSSQAPSEGKRRSSITLLPDVEVDSPPEAVPNVETIDENNTNVTSTPARRNSQSGAFTPPRRSSRPGSRRGSLTNTPNRGSRRGSLSGMESPETLARRASVSSSRRSSRRSSLVESERPELVQAVDSALGNRRGSLKRAAEAKEAASKAMNELEAKLVASHAGQKDHLVALLKAHTVDQLPKVPKVFIINSDSDPIAGFDGLLERNILSAPLYDPETSTYTGFLDVRDLVSSIVHAHEQKETGIDRFNEVIVRAMAEDTQGVPVSLKYLSRRNPWRPVTEADTLYDVAVLLSKPGIHRVPVVNPEGECTNIISQSSMVTWLHANKRAKGVPGELKQTLQSLKLGIKSVIQVPASSTALSAFSMLDEANISGVAVVDARGKLLGNTSAKDIKYFVLDRGQLTMDVPILDYLAKIRQRDIGDEQHPSCSIRPTATLGQVIDLLHATRFHRVFLVDAHDVPVGVISITDVLRFLTDNIFP